MSDVYLFQGYSHVGLFRAEKRGGGVSIYAKTGLQCDLIDEYSAITSDLEVIAVRCSSFCILTVYRPPSGKVECFVDHMDKTLAHVSSSGQCAIIVGDVNIDLLTYSNAQCEFLWTMCCYDFQNLVNCATRVTATSEALLDVCFTSYCRGRMISGVLSADVSDHLAVFCALEIYVARKKVPAYKTRIINDTTIEIFVELVKQADWSDVLNEESSGVCFTTFYSKIKDLYSNAFPEYYLRKHKKSEEALDMRRTLEQN